MLSILRTSPMLRTVLTALLLAALTAVSAGAVQTTHSTRAHKTTASAHASHRTAYRSSTHAARHTARPRGRYASHRSAASTTHRRRATLRRVRAERLRTTPRYAQPVPAAAGDESPTPETPVAGDSASEPAVAAPARETAPPAASQIASLHSPRIIAIAPLRGSHYSLVRQNEKSEADDLERIENDDDLNDRIARGMLVPVPASAALTVNGNLPRNRRYCRPWTAHFLADLARAHQAQFHHPLEVSSAVRTVEYQKRLIEVNGNAAAAEGDVVSPHVTGATIDIAKSGLSQREIYWMRSHLLPLQDAGKIDVEEEFQQACFHITVYKTYLTPRPAHKPRRRVEDTPPSPAPDTPPTPAGIASTGL